MDYKPRKFRLPENDLLKSELDAPAYLFTEPVALAVDVALATGRPLLITGDPGCGKTALASAMARTMGLPDPKAKDVEPEPWRFLSYTFTSRSTLGDLTADVDQLRRLHDAQLRKKQLPPPWSYVEPGLLWWAFNPESARLRGKLPGAAAGYDQYVAPVEPAGATGSRHAVLLLDEIDKAEPDLPNDLLEPMETRGFTAPNGCGEVRADPTMRWLVVITTNGERELPPAFVRRCVCLNLTHPEPDQLEKIGLQRFPNANASQLKSLAQSIENLRQRAVRENRRAPSTSEFLDAVKVMLDLEIDESHARWDDVVNLTLLKNPG